MNERREKLKKDLDEKRIPIALVIEAHDPVNIGSLIRTAHAFLIKEILLVGTTTFHKRGAQKTEQWENITVFPTPEEAIEYLRNNHYTSIALETGINAVNLQDIVYDGNPVAFILGDESVGISEALLKSAHLTATIPQRGLIKSLNVTVAGSIAIYDYISKTSM